jgi:NAD(P)-dependent dehydrogenase (short-subunit alcohol dehydrogenase family)
MHACTRRGIIMKLPFQIDLSGKTAVVTGGGGILCSSFAKVLAECGARVAILDLRKEAADKVAAEIIEAGGKAIGVGANVLDAESLKAARETVNNAFGPCGILINGAGGNNPKGTTTKDYLFKEDLESKTEGVMTFFDLDQKGIEFVFNLNFLGTLMPTQAFARDMINQDGAVIINISSMNAFCPLTRIPAYSGAKAAVSNFTQWLAVHFSKVGIRVNAIAPGFFITDQNRAMLIKEDGSYSERANKIVNMTPMGRFGESEELIGTLLWLVSNDASGFVNGTVIPVDGGFSAYSGV